MKNLTLLGCVLLFSIKVFAHQPDISTTMLVQQKDNSWKLQVSASLTAFQQEINTHFSETPYTTPEEFQEMVIEHIKKNMHLHFDGNEEVALEKGIVKLGHETKVVFKVLNVPSSFHYATVENTTFNDVFKSQSALFFLKEGFNKKQFILNEANDYTLELRVVGNEFVATNVQEASLIPSTMIIILIASILSGLLFFSISVKRTIKK